MPAHEHRLSRRPGLHLDRRTFVIGGLAGTGVLGLGAWAAAPAPGTVRLGAPRMGTVWRIEATRPRGWSEVGVRRLLSDALAEAGRIEAMMSEFRSDSAVGLLNSHAGGPAVRLPDELAALLHRAVELGRASEGAFDPTWRTLAAAWPLTDPAFRLPDPDTVRRLRAGVGLDGLELSGLHARLARPGMAVGLGGIAKGYGVDRAAAVLEREGLRDYLIDGGGDLRVRGRRAGRPWRLGIRDPRGGPERLLGTLEVKGGALVTSGDYERYRTLGGRRYHHILDPRTGWPAPAVRQVTVAASSADEADALATAAFVLGPQAGLDLLARRGAEGLVVGGDGRRHASGALHAFADA